ncbi:hypothetical protein [Microbacterium testaceum]|uniref:hypothetical protein n=1 Tax=Microbacterium testaceum TaxID=2033 RepID=UPI00124905DB|nr:hypothetical protein [Microbacterium testaceum]
MPDAPSRPGNQAWHLGASAAGVVAIATSVWAPPGLVGDLLVLVVAVCSLLFALDAGRRRGPLRWAAVAGALLAGLAMIVAAAVFLVALARALP